MTAEDGLISVVTPTYDRADLLVRLGKTVAERNAEIIEWIIVDDGSTDGTAERVEEMRGWLGIPLRYQYQDNAGRMAAVNRGVELASGELVALMDSDDCFTGSLEPVVRAWRGIPEKARGSFAGVVAACADVSGQPLAGSTLPEHAFDTDLVALSEVHRISGDRKEFLRPEILKANPYVLVPGERRVATSTIWPAISERYQVRFVPVVVVQKTYLHGGLTANIDQLRRQSPLSSRRRYWNYLAYRGTLPARSILKNGANYLRYCLHARRRPQWRPLPWRRRLLLIVSAPAAAGYYLKDRLRQRMDRIGRRR